jgi:hypothetical protein
MIANSARMARQSALIVEIPRGFTHNDRQRGQPTLVSLSDPSAVFFVPFVIFCSNFFTLDAVVSLHIGDLSCLSHFDSPLRLPC